MAKRDGDVQLAVLTGESMNLKGTAAEGGHCMSDREFEGVSLNDAPMSHKLLPSDVEIAQEETSGGAAGLQKGAGGEDSDKPPEREKWSRQIEFLLACVGFSVGLGNVWRFPYLCYRNGGGAFLIPYLISVVICGIPVSYLEVAIGQFMNVAGLKAYNFAPIMKGVGIATMIIVFYLNCYYNVIMTWAFHYLFHSFTSSLPWGSCGNAWNSPNCTVPVSGVTAPSTATDPAIEYWENYVLDISDGIGNPGSVKWDLALCLLLAWVTVFLCICQGIKSSGKVMYVTATTPYLLLTALLIRGVTLPGAAQGLYFYLRPEFHKLQNLQVWVDAGTQVFFSYSLGIGVLTALGSFNKFRHNSYRDTVIFTLVNSGTSIFAGLAVFSTVGFMAETLGKPVAEVATSGPGLAFIAYPTALNQMPAPGFWSVLFFLMVLLLGIDSQMVGVEGLITALCDQFPVLKHTERRRILFVVAMCALQFLLGPPMVTNGGMYVFQLFDYFSGSRIITLIALAQFAAIAIFGMRRWYNSVALMIGSLPGWYLKANWTALAPIWCLSLFIMGTVTGGTIEFSTTRYGPYTFPDYSIALGWLMAVSSIIFIPAAAMWMIGVHMRSSSGGGHLGGRLWDAVAWNLQPAGLQPHQVRQFSREEWEDDVAQDQAPHDQPASSGSATKGGAPQAPPSFSSGSTSTADSSSVAKRRVTATEV